MASRPPTTGLGCYEEARMQDCLAIQGPAGLEILHPDDVPEGEPNQYVASANACWNVALLPAIAEAARDGSRSPRSTAASPRGSPRARPCRSTRPVAIAGTLDAIRAHVGVA
jgi:hypothetical protein